MSTKDPQEVAAKGTSPFPLFHFHEASEIVLGVTDDKKEDNEFVLGGENEAMAMNGSPKGTAAPFCESSKRCMSLSSLQRDASEVPTNPANTVSPLLQSRASRFLDTGKQSSEKGLKHPSVDGADYSADKENRETGEEEDEDDSTQLSRHISAALALTIGEVIVSSQLDDLEVPEYNHRSSNNGSASNSNAHTGMYRSSETITVESQGDPPYVATSSNDSPCSPTGTTSTVTSPAYLQTNPITSTATSRSNSRKHSGTTTSLSNAPVFPPSFSPKINVRESAAFHHSLSSKQGSEDTSSPLHAANAVSNHSSTEVGEKKEEYQGVDTRSPTPLCSPHQNNGVRNGRKEDSEGLPDTTIHYDPSIPHTEENVIFVRHCVTSITDIFLCYQCFGTYISPERTPVLLLVCGLNMQLYAWDEAFCEDLVRAGFFVIRYDNRDSGLSSKVERGCVKGYLLLLPSSLASTLGERMPYTLEDMAKDGVALLDALHIPKAHVMGISMGGMVAQLMALVAPSRIVSLTSIMSSTNARDLPDAQLQVKLWMLRKPPEPCSMNTLLNFRVHALQKVLPRTLTVDSYYLKRRFLISLKRSRYTNGLIRQACAIMRCPPRDDLLRQLHIPALVIHGTQDLIVPPLHGWRTAEVLPHARLLVLKHMGHYFHPAFYQTVILAFSAMASATPYYCAQPSGAYTNTPKRKRGALRKAATSSPSSTTEPFLSSAVNNAVETNLSPSSSTSGGEGPSSSAVSFMPGQSPNSTAPESNGELQSEASMGSPVFMISNASPLPVASLVFPVTLPTALMGGDLESVEAISGGGVDGSGLKDGALLDSCAEGSTEGKKEEHAHGQEGQSEETETQCQENEEVRREDDEALTLRHSALYPVVVALHSRCGAEVKKSIAVAVPLPHSSNTPEAALMDLHELPDVAAREGSLLDVQCISAQDSSSQAALEGTAGVDPLSSFNACTGTTPAPMKEGEETIKEETRSEEGNGSHSAPLSTPPSAGPSEEPTRPMSPSMSDGHADREKTRTPPTTSGDRCVGAPESHEEVFSSSLTMREESREREAPLDACKESTEKGAEEGAAKTSCHEVTEKESTPLKGIASDVGRTGNAGERQGPFFLFSRADGVKPFRSQDRSVWHTAFTSRSVTGPTGRSCPHGEDCSGHASTLPTTSSTTTPTSGEHSTGQRVFPTPPSTEKVGTQGRMSREENGSRLPDSHFLASHPSTTTANHSSHTTGPLTTAAAPVNPEGVEMPGQKNVAPGSISRIATSAKRLFGLVSDFFE